MTGRCAQLRGDLCLAPNPEMLPGGDLISPLIAAMWPQNMGAPKTPNRQGINFRSWRLIETTSFMPCRNKKILRKEILIKARIKNILLIVFCRLPNHIGSCMKNAPGPSWNFPIGVGARGPAGARRSGSGGALAYPWLKRYSMVGRAEHQEHARLSGHAVQKHARCWAVGAA